MRILVFDVPASKGGALSILKDFVSYIDKRVCVHEWYFVVSTEELNTHNPKIHMIRESFSKRSWVHRAFWEVFIANKIAKTLNPDVILSLQNTAIMFTTIPQIIYVHQSIPFCKDKRWIYFSLEELKYVFYRDIFRFLIGRSVRKADKVIVQTSWMKEALVDSYGIPDSKIEVIPPSITNIPLSEKGLSYEGGATNKFFYPAGPSLYKNFEVIIEAVKKLLEQKYAPKVYLTIKGDENRYTARIKKMLKGLEDNFKLLGSIPREQVFKFYQTSILLFPSYLETFGLPLLEARLFNTPIIVSDRPFAREILEGYPNVDFFDPFSPDDLADKMKKYLESDFFSYTPLDVDREMEIINKYSPENTWGKIVKLLESLSEEGAFK